MSTLFIDVEPIKKYLQIEHDADDDVLTFLINEAEGLFQHEVRRLAAPGTDLVEHFDGGVSRFFLRDYPLQSGSVTVTDTKGTPDISDDETFDTDLYRIDERRGWITRTTANGTIRLWAHGHRRWKVAYKGGLDQHPDWNSGEHSLKRMVTASIRDLVAHWYLNENPGATQVREGDVSKTVISADVPPRVQRVWDRLKDPVF